MKRFICTSILLLGFLSIITTQSQAQGTVPHYERAECPLDVPSNVSIECGIFTTLEDYNKSNVETIRTSVIIIHSQNGDPSNEAMLFTEGGPGYSSLPSVWWLAGRYDPITPLEWSRAALVNLTDTTIVEFPASGHSVTTNNPCAIQIIASFLGDPDNKLDLSCVDTAPRPKFVLPSEIIIAPAMYEIHFGELGYSMLEENIFLLSWLTLCGTGLVALVLGLVKLVQGRKLQSGHKAECFAHLLLIALPITALVWGYGLRFCLQSVASTTSNVLRFGLPVAYWWIFVIAILIGLMTIILFAFTILAWKRSYWSVPGRIAISITTLAAITFSGLLAYWGFFTALFR